MLIYHVYIDIHHLYLYIYIYTHHLYLYIYIYVCTNVYVYCICIYIHTCTVYRTWHFYSLSGTEDLSDGCARVNSSQSRALPVSHQGNVPCPSQSFIHRLSIDYPYMNHVLTIYQECKWVN